MKLKLHKGYLGVIKEDGKMKTLPALKMGVEDIQDIINKFEHESNRSRWTKQAKALDTVIEGKHEECIPALYDVINNNIEEIDLDGEEGEENEIPYKKTLSPSFSPSFAEFSCAAVTLASQYPRDDLNCKPSLWIIGPSGTGKSESMELCNSPDLMNWTGRSTLHAWLPGIPNSDTERDPGVIERSDGRCICMNECSNFESDKASDKVLGALADLLTIGHITISDPAGDYNVKSDVTGLFGMTPKLYLKMLKKSAGIGQRYLMLKTENDRQNHSSFRREISKHNKRVEIVNWIRTTAKEEELKDPTDAMIDLAFDYATKTLDARGILNAHSIHETTGATRLSDQLVYMGLMRANLLHHDPSVDDVKYFLRLLAPMIGWRDVFEKLLDIFGDHNTPQYIHDFNDKSSNYKDLKMKDFHFTELGILKTVKEPRNYLKIDLDWFIFLQEMKKWW
jgi:hypothetical protein